MKLKFFLKKVLKEKLIAIKKIKIKIDTNWNWYNTCNFWKGEMKSMARKEKGKENKSTKSNCCSAMHRLLTKEHGSLPLTNTCVVHDNHFLFFLIIFIFVKILNISPFNLIITKKNHYRNIKTPMNITFIFFVFKGNVVIWLCNQSIKRPKNS